ncbi:hypothetical protein [Streptomyces graminilatus]|uniref:hypothetical protein n=1 Tax=Streptomyces graminilatus TaxID=1464070 RepID=UPI000A4DC0CC|nr:hypothetical protein [Streptomyces graminilatus]
MIEKKFKRGQAVYDSSALGRERVTVVRYTAHDLIEIKDQAGRKGWINSDDAKAWANS